MSGSEEIFAASAQTERHVTISDEVGYSATPPPLSGRSEGTKGECEARREAKKAAHDSAMAHRGQKGLLEWHTALTEQELGNVTGSMDMNGKSFAPEWFCHDRRHSEHQDNGGVGGPPAGGYFNRPNWSTYTENADEVARNGQALHIPPPKRGKAVAEHSPLPKGPQDTPYALFDDQEPTNLGISTNKFKESKKSRQIEARRERQAKAPKKVMTMGTSIQDQVDGTYDTPYGMRLLQQPIHAPDTYRVAREYQQEKLSQSSTLLKQKKAAKPKIVELGPSSFQELISNKYQTQWVLDQQEKKQKHKEEQKRQVVRMRQAKAIIVQSRTKRITPSARKEPTNNLPPINASGGSTTPQWK